MSWATASVLIVAMSLALPVVLQHMKASRRRSSRRGDSQRAEQHERELAELRERVETLESIVTDGRYQLEREFERLENGEAPPRGPRQADR